MHENRMKTTIKKRVGVITIAAAIQSLVRSLVKSKTLVKSCMHSSINNGTMCDTHGLVPKEIKFLLRGH